MTVLGVQHNSDLWSYKSALEATREWKMLSRWGLPKELKLKCMALASLERIISCQRSRLLWLTEYPMLLPTSLLLEKHESHRVAGTRLHRVQ